MPVLQLFQGKSPSGMQGSEVNKMQSHPTLVYQ
jgi:hypothetical protein